MKKLILTPSITFLILHCVFSQDYLVNSAKRSYKGAGEKIKKEDLINVSETVVIKEKGKMVLDVGSSLDLELGEGHHSIDSAVAAHNLQYKNHDSIESELSKRGLLNCEFRYDIQLAQNSHNAHIEVGRIEVLEKDLIRIKLDSANSVELDWKTPDQEYDGSYLVIVQDAKNEGYLGLLETKESSINLTLENYAQSLLLYTIKAEDCRSSSPQAILFLH